MSSPRAETLFNLLHEARTKNQGHLSREEWLKIAQDFLDGHVGHQVPDMEVRPRHSASNQTRTLPNQTDAEWIAYLESVPHLQGIDIQREIGKAQLYWGERKRPCTRRHLINWLNRAEKTVAFNGQRASSWSASVQPAQTLPEPPNWRIAFPDFIHRDRPWGQLDRTTQQHISQEMQKLK